jgi:ethanolamine transporter EutH
MGYQQQSGIDNENQHHSYLAQGIIDGIIEVPKEH